MRVWKWRSTSQSTVSVSSQIDAQSTSPLNMTTAWSWSDSYFTIGVSPVSANARGRATGTMPPRGGASCLVFLPLPSIPDSPPSRPDPPHSRPGTPPPVPRGLRPPRHDRAPPGAPQATFSSPPGLDGGAPPPVHGRGRRPLRERGGRGQGMWGSAPPAAASHPWTGGAAGCGLARRGRRRASGAVGGYVKPRTNGEQRCAMLVMAEGRRRGARKRCAPCRTRRRRGRRRVRCGRDRRAGSPDRAGGRRRVNRGRASRTLRARRTSFQAPRGRALTRRPRVGRPTAPALPSGGEGAPAASAAHRADPRRPCARPGETFDDSALYDAAHHPRCRGRHRRPLQPLVPALRVLTAYSGPK